jgi:hypothetical protein
MIEMFPVEKTAQILVPAVCGVTVSCGGTTNRKVIFWVAETKMDENEETILHELRTLDPYIVIT